jgi:hypothetical protein
MMDDRSFNLAGMEVRESKIPRGAELGPEGTPVRYDVQFGPAFVARATATAQALASVSIVVLVLRAFLERLVSG